MKQELHQEIQAKQEVKQELHQEIQPKLEVKQELHYVDSSSSDVDGPPSKKRTKTYDRMLIDGYEVFGSSN